MKEEPVYRVVTYDLWGVRRTSPATTCKLVLDLYVDYARSMTRDKDSVRVRNARRVGRGKRSRFVIEE